MTEPKRENMDGHSFEQWQKEIGRVLTLLTIEAFYDKGEARVKMFNANYDPATAASEWLRSRLTRPLRHIK